MPHPPETRHIIRIKSDKITFSKMTKSGFSHAENFRIHLIFEKLWDSCASSPLFRICRSEGRIQIMLSCSVSFRLIFYPEGCRTERDACHPDRQTENQLQGDFLPNCRTEKRQIAEQKKYQINVFNKITPNIHI